MRAVLRCFVLVAASAWLGLAQSGPAVETLIAAALEQADPEAVYSIMIVPDLDPAARQALEVDARELLPYQDFSSRGGIPPPGILLVEAVVFPATGSAPESTESPPPIAADIDLWLGEAPGFRLPDPPPGQAFGSLSCGIRWRMRLEWRAREGTWELVWGRETDEPKPRTRLSQC
jgi:hypothetical protein